MLSTFKVNTTLDTVAVSLKTGKDASGHISLRSAIMAANAKPNSDTIILPTGTFKLTIAGAAEDGDATGDLDINGNVTIKGKRSSSTIIDGNNLDRVLEVLGGKVSISNVTIQHGRAVNGAGLFNQGGKVSLSDVNISNNLAIGADGGVGGAGSGGGRDGNVGGAGGAGINAAGGGVFNAAGTLSITNSVIASNQAVGGAGGIGGGGGNGAGPATASLAQTDYRRSAAMAEPAAKGGGPGRWGFQRRGRQHHHLGDDVLRQQGNRGCGWPWWVWRLGLRGRRRR